jgi:hypothetical protein
MGIGSFYGSIFSIIYNIFTKNTYFDNDQDENEEYYYLFGGYLEYLSQ